jgi:two-component system chemotaxis response regulator CheY
MVARKILEGLDLVVEEAENGQDALTACRLEMPDAVLLDWTMPVMSGLDFLRELRAIEGIEQPRVLFCTAQNNPQRIEAALEAGADEYIMKPFDNEIISSKLSQVGLV